MLKDARHKKLHIGLILQLIIVLYAASLSAGQLTLSWTSPVVNADGTYLTDLAGFKIYYGTESGNYPNTIDVGNVTMHLINDLPDGIPHFFTVAAYDTSGNESGYSNEEYRITPTSPAPSEVSCDIPAECGLVEVQVESGQDDAEESASGSISLTSSDLELVDERTNQTVGMRFTRVEIPQGATIINAYIQFQVDEISTGASSLLIQGEATEDAGTFTSRHRDISGRPPTTASEVWTPPDWTREGEAGPDQQTPDISSVIQEIVDQQGWRSGNSLVVMITGTGRRTAESYNGIPSGAPTLYVEFSAGETICDDGTDNDNDGLTDCEDPDCEGMTCNDGQYCNEGETCQSGVCTGGSPLDCDDGVGCTDDSCDEANDSCENVSNDANCPDDGLYCNGDEYCDSINDCSSTGTPCLPGEICDESIAQCEESDCQSDVDCDDGVFCNGQETCNLSTGQCDAGIPINCDDGNSCTDDYCNEVTDSCDNVAVCGIVEVQVESGQDDAEEGASGGVGLTSSDLELVYNNTNQTVGMRFTRVDIPQGATIIDAYIQFQVDDVSTGASSLLIQGEAAEDAGTFTSRHRDISGRPPTIASEVWTPPDWTRAGEAGPDQQTPDISSVIQEIVDQQGWRSGNSLAIMITGTGTRSAESYNGLPSGAPTLYVEFTTGQ